MKYISIVVMVSLILLSPTVLTKYVEAKEPGRYYIVEFRYPALADIWKNLHEGNRSVSVLLSYRKSIQSLHEKFKRWLSRRVDGVESRDYFKILNAIRVRIPNSIIPLIRDLPYVKDVYPDLRVQSLLRYSLPLIRLYDFLNIRNLTGRNVTVAVVDTGIDYTHPDLKDAYAGGYDLINGDSDPYDDNGHGTHVCGIIAGNGNMSNGTYRGIAPGVKIYMYKALDEYGYGHISTIESAIEKAVDPNDDLNFSDHPDILSLSLGIADAFSGTEGNPDDTLSRAVDRAVEIGVTVVVAAGNSGWDFTDNKPITHTIFSPACAREAIAVGAVTDINGSIPSGGPDHIALYSARGPSYLLTVKPDVVAPGGDVNIYLDTTNLSRYDYAITSTRARDCKVGKSVNRYYVKLGGTSMAAPHVSGVVALLLEEHPDWDPFEVRAALRYTAKDLGYPMIYQGFGRLDAYNLLNLSTPPPVAIFFDAKEEMNEKIVFTGVAKSRNFLSYRLYYKFAGPKNPDRFDIDGSWRQLYNGFNEVREGTIFEWNTTDLKEGWYLVKLDVRDTFGRESNDYILVRVEHKKFFLQIPNSVSERERFRVYVRDEHNNAVSAIFIMSSLFRIPRIRIGDYGEFTAYNIRSDKLKWIKANVWVIIPYEGKLYIKKESITIFNR